MALVGWLILACVFHGIGSKSQLNGEVLIHVKISQYKQLFGSGAFEERLRGTKTGSRACSLSMNC